MKGVLYISFLVCILLGAAIVMACRTGEKTKQPVLSWK